MRSLPTIGSFVLLVVLTAAPARGTVFSDAEMICQFLNQTVGGATALVPTDPSGADDCPALCQKWVRFCRGAVAKTTACLRSAARRVAALGKAECATLDDAGARKTCRDGVSTELATAKQTIAGLPDFWNNECMTNGLTTCLNTCN